MLEVQNAQYPFWSQLKCKTPAHTTPEVLPVSLTTGSLPPSDPASVAMRKLTESALTASGDVFNVGKTAFEYLPNFYIADYRPKKLFDVVHTDWKKMPERYVIFEVANLNIPGKWLLARSFTRYPVWCNVNSILVQGSWETRSAVKCPIRRTVPLLTSNRLRFFAEPTKLLPDPSDKVGCSSKNDYIS